MAKKKEKPDGRRICTCECGGTVYGVEELDRLFSACDTCTPVVSIRVLPPRWISANRNSRS
jgi:hypothetical protein